MNDQQGTAAPQALLAVTSGHSLKLMTGLPERLAMHGWNVHVVADVTSGLADQDGVTYHSLAMARGPNPRADAHSLVAWLRLLREIRPDVVVAGTPKAGLLGILSARMCRVPVRIYHLRGLRLESERGWKLKLLSMLERLTARSSTVVLAVSESLRDEFVARGLALSERVALLGAGSSNGVDVTKFSRSQDGVVRGIRQVLELDPQRSTVGFVGRITPDKGVATLIAAVGSLRRTGVDVQLLLVGRVEEQQDLDSMLRDAGIPAARIKYAGFVADTAPYYQLMDVLCLPTRREGFPNVVLEASASGVPTVASRVTGCVDAVVDGETGRLFTVDDHEALSGMLASLLRDDEARKRLGLAAQRFVTRNFDRAAVQDRLEAFLGEQLELSRGR